MFIRILLFCTIISLHIAIGQTPSKNFNDAIANFGFELLKTETSENNIILSPYSIVSALAMTYAGAASETAKELEQVFGFDEDIHPWFSKNIQEITSLNSRRSPDYEVSLANSLWAEQSYFFTDEFIKTIADEYNSSINLLDFKNEFESSRLTINDWAAEQTNNRIQNLLPPESLNKDTRLVLTNAIYFKAEWANRFFKGNTSKENFNLASGEVIQTETLHYPNTIYLDFSYLETESFELIELPFKGYSTTMQIILPKIGMLNSVLNNLSSENLKAYNQQMTSRKINPYIPKFEFDSAFKLKDSLRQLGLESAFIKFEPAHECATNQTPTNNPSDFSKMDETRCLYLSDAHHNAFITINEDGAEATAATAAVIAIAESGPLLPPIDLKIDRPFIFTIKHNQTNTLLFLGTVMNPLE